MPILIRQTRFAPSRRLSAAFKDRCGMQVSPTDALTVLADL